jgi:hypothetical protein
MISRSFTGRTLPGVSVERTRVSVVPLEAGAGPDNPPCPACGEPLFGWIGSRPGLPEPIRRCEGCGLGVLGDAGDVATALAALEGSRREGVVRIVNRGAISASLGGTGWAGLQPGVRYLFTVESVRRLIANRDQVVAATRWSPGAGIALMWQTILNGLTFGRNVALGALGRAVAVPAEPLWQRRLDAAISVLAAVPALLVAVPLELAAAATRRGSSISLRLELL